MAQIGTFTRGEDGSFTGQIRTLNISTKETIHPVAKEGERSPDYRVAANGIELGAGWSKAAKDTGAEYVSVKLDDPSFTARSTRPWSRPTTASTSSSGRVDRTAPPRPSEDASLSPSRLCTRVRETPPKYSTRPRHSA